MLSRFVLVGIAALSLSGCISLNPFGGAPETAPAAAAAQGAVTASRDPRVADLLGSGTEALGGPAVGAYMDGQETELRAALRDTGVSVTRIGNNIVLNLPSGRVFAAGNATVQNGFLPVLMSVAIVLDKFDSTLVDVYGYTDSEGPEAYNLDLSQRRAVAVATILAGNGVDQRRFYIKGKGEADPIASNADEDGRARNRRVEIHIAPIVEG